MDWIVDAADLALFARSLAAVVSEGILTLNGVTLSIRAVDFTNAAYIQATLTPYLPTLGSPSEVPPEEEVGLDITKLNGFMKQAGPLGGTVHIDRAGPHHTSFYHLPQDAACPRTALTLKNLLVDTIRRRPNPPTFTPGTSGGASGPALLKALEMVAVVSDRVVLEGGTETGTAFATFTLSSHPEQEVKATIWTSDGHGPPARSIYSLDYLRDIVKAMGQEEAIKMAFDTDRPLTLSINQPGVKVIYHLAPRREVGD